MAAINEIVSKAAVDGVVALDKAIVKTDDDLDLLLKSAVELNKIFEKTAKATTDTAVKTEQYTKIITKTKEQQVKLSKVETERIKIREQQRQVLAKVIVSQEKSAQILVKGKLALQENNKQLKENAQNQRTVNERLKSGQKDAATITGRYKALSAELNKNRALAKDIAVAYGRNSVEFKKVAKDVNKLDKEFKSVDSSLGQSQRKVGQYGDALGGLSPRFSGMIGMAKQAGTALTALFANPVGLVIAAVAGLGVIIGKAVGQAKDYQAANAELAGVLGITRSETIALQAESQRLGASTAFSAQEVANLQIEYARLGLSQNEIKAVTESTINLSIAAKSGAAETAAFVGSTIKGMGLSADEAARVTDVAAKSFSSSALDFSKLSTALAAAGPAAKASGKSLEFTTARLGKLADAGLDASTSGSSLRNIFLDLSKSGMTYDEAMNEINTSTNKNATAMDLFGKRGAISALILADQADAAKELELALEGAGGSAKAMADEQLDTLDGSLKLLGSAWSGFLFAFEDGEGIFMKVWKGLVDGATWFLSTWTSVIKKVGEGFDAVKRGFKAVTDIFKSEDRKQREAAEAAAKEKAKLDAEALEQAKKDNASKTQLDAELLAAKTEADKEAQAEAAKRLKEATKLEEEEAKERLQNHIQNIEARKRLTKQLLDFDKAAQKEFSDFMKADEAEMIAEMAQEEETAQAEFTAQQNAEIQERERYYAERIMMAEANGESILDIEKDIVNEQISAIEALLAATGDGTVEQIELEQELADKRLELNQIVADDDKQKTEERREQIVGLAQDVAGIANQAFDFGTELRSRELADIEAQAEAGLISEEEAATKSAEIQRKQDIADKASALFNIAVNTAIAATKVTAQTGIGAALAIPLVIASGAIQAAAVLAQPITPVPTFAKGEKYGTPDSFIAGEAGRELMTLKTGEMMMVNQATHFEGNKFKGAKIKTNAETEFIMNQTQHNGFSSSSFSDAQIVGKLSDVEKAIKSMPVPIYSKNGSLIGTKINGNSSINLAKLRS